MALGIDLAWHKRVLGFWQGATENHEICDALLGDLETRGCALVKRTLFVTDGGTGLIKALFVRDGIGQVSPWGQLRGQIYLGSEAWVAKHQPDRVLREVPRAQTQAHRPTLKQLFSGKQIRDRAILRAYRRYGYRLREIAEHLRVHYATVSRRLKQAESRDV